VLRIFTSTGTAVAGGTSDNAADPDTGLFGNDSAARFVALTTATYYVGVSAFPNLRYDPITSSDKIEGTSCGDYRILFTVTKASALGDAPNRIADVTATTSIRRGSNVEIVEQVGDSDVDLYRVQLVEDDVLSIDIDSFEIGLVGLDSVLRVFDRFGKELALNDDGFDPESNDFSRDSALQFVATERCGATGLDPCQYYVGVSGFPNLTYDPTQAGSTVGTSGGSYHLILGLNNSRAVAPGGPIVPEQVVWLNFEGGSADNGWPYAQSVPPLALSAFGSAPFQLAPTRRQELIDRVLDLVRQDFVTGGSVENPNTPVNLPIELTLTRPARQPYMTLFLGAGACGFLGLAESVDRDNRILADHARVCSDEIARQIRPEIEAILAQNPAADVFHLVAQAIADTASHEIGHNLGLRHLGLDSDGYLMQSGLFDDFRTDDERFGETAQLTDLAGLTQNDIEILRRNLRRSAADDGDLPLEVLPLEPGRRRVRRGLRLTNSSQRHDFDIMLNAGDNLEVDLAGRQNFGSGARFTVVASLLDHSGSSFELMRNSVGRDRSGFTDDPYLNLPAPVTATYRISVQAEFDSGSPAPDQQRAGKYRIDFLQTLGAGKEGSQDAFSDQADATPDKVLQARFGQPLRFSDAAGRTIEVAVDQAVDPDQTFVFVRLQGGAANGANVDSIHIDAAAASDQIRVEVLAAGASLSRVGNVVVAGHRATETSAPRIGELRLIGLDVERLVIDGGIDNLTIDHGDVLGLVSICDVEAALGCTAGSVAILGTGSQLAGRLLLGGTTASLQIQEVMPGGMVDATGQIVSATLGRLDAATFRSAAGVGTLTVQQPSTGQIEVAAAVSTLRLGTFGTAPDPNPDLDVQDPSRVSVAGRISRLDVSGDLHAGVFGDAIDCVQISGTRTAPIETSAGTLITDRTPLSGRVVEQRALRLLCGDGDIIPYTAPQSGVATFQLFFSHAAGNLDLEIRNSSGTVLASSAGAGDEERVDLAVAAAQPLQIRVFAPGSAPNTFDLKATTAVARGDAGELIVHAGDTADAISIGRNAAGSGSGDVLDIELAGLAADALSPQHATRYTPAQLRTLLNVDAIPVSRLVVHGDGGSDRITIDAAIVLASTLTGDAGNDTISGGSGADQASGGDGADSILGTAGSDLLAGDAGPDTLLGGAGVDQLDGGADANLLDFGSTPAALLDAATTAEDTERSIAVLANDSDSDGQTLTIVGLTMPAHGAAGVAPDGTILYTPDAHYFGSDSFTYTIRNQEGITAGATVEVTVTSVNDVPVATDDMSTTEEDTAVELDVLLNDRDADGDALAVLVVTGPASGTLTPLGGGRFRYTPGANRHGTDSFTYTAQDPAGASATATATITAAPVNDGPVAGNDAATIDEDTILQLAVLDNDSDVDGDALVLTSVTLPANGTARILLDGRLEYTPRADFAGSDSLMYSVRDPAGATASATLAITVTAINDNPVARPDAAITLEDNPVSISVLDNDSDVEGGTLTIANLVQPQHGLVLQGAGQTLRYEPNANYSGGDSFTYTIRDAAGGSATTTVTLTIAPINDDPIAAGDSASLLEDTFALMDLLANDSDRFTYTATDGSGQSATAAVDLTVVGVPDLEVISLGTASATPHRLRLTYRVTGAAVLPFEIGFVTSLDARFGPDDIEWSPRLAISSPADRTLGEHTITVDAAPYAAALTDLDMPYFLALADIPSAQPTGARRRGAAPKPVGAIHEADETNNDIHFVGLFYQPAAAATPLVIRGRDDTDRSSDEPDDRVTITTPGAGLVRFETDLIDAPVTAAATQVSEIRILLLGGDDRVDAQELSLTPDLRRGVPIDARGGTGDDTLTGGAATNRLAGAAGNDELRGGPNHDSLDGGDGNDLLVGGDGQDQLDAGPDNDTVFGGAGADLAIGRSGSDFVDAGSDNDTVKGNGGNDTIFGGDGNDSIHGHQGHDSLLGGLGNDTLRGGSGDDSLTGDSGADFAFDLLFGDAGFDLLLADFLDVVDVGRGGGEVILH
jgi:Ca2+-binding RTX toxin-like protein